MKTDGTWISLQPDPTPKKWRKWYGMFYVTPEGAIFIPAVLLGNEMSVFLCASADGVRIVVSGKHLWVSLEWAKRDYYDPAHHPKKVLCELEKLEQHVRTATTNVEGQRGY